MYGLERPHACAGNKLSNSQYHFTRSCMAYRYFGACIAVEHSVSIKSLMDLILFLVDYPQW